MVESKIIAISVGVALGGGVFMGSHLKSGIDEIRQMAVQRDLQGARDCSGPRPLYKDQVANTLYAERLLERVAIKAPTEPGDLIIPINTEDVSVIIAKRNQMCWDNIVAANRPGDEHFIQTLLGFGVVVGGGMTALAAFIRKPSHPRLSVRTA